ncbi:MAG: carboxypeptidase-like regulatory domain-containing protein, partial [Proteobacteria bacterium]|nr:carboxypeptidase-like regulatory domain-containing protein [Pseudomonadota bacterium]
MTRTRAGILAIAMVAIVVGFVVVRSCRRADEVVAPSVARDAGAGHDRAWVRALRDRAAGSIAGRVVAEGGAALVATICATNVDARGAPACTTSTPTGAYTLELAAGTYAVWASANGFRGRRRPDDVHVESAARTDAVDFALAAGGVRLVGSVRDPRGTGLADAVVMIGPSRRAIAVTTHSASDGTFEAWVAPGDQVLTASAVGHVDAELVVDAADLDALDAPPIVLV